MQRVAKSLLLLVLLLLVMRPVKAQGTILFLPLIFKGSDMILKSTIGIVSPYGNTNYVLNSSGEITGNYSAIGTAVINRTSFPQKYGLYSYGVVSNAPGDGLELTLLALENTTNYVTFRLHNPESVKPINVTVGAATKEARFVEKIDTEWSLYTATFNATESGGETALEITTTDPGSSRNFYLDGIQVEPLTEDTPLPYTYSTYIDGTQEGCRWLGAPNASASTRSADSRAGGVVKSFWEGYGFFPEKALGMGTAVEELNIDSFAFLPGGELNSSKIPPREFSIIGYFLGGTVEELHEQAQALELELGLDTYPGRQPVRLRYFGAKVQKEIAARYAGGLEGDLPIYYNDDNSVEDEHWTTNFKFKMKASIQFVATDPFWYEVGESATLLDTNGSANFETVAARLLDNPTWDNMGPPNPAGGYADVSAIVEDSVYLYLGGQYTNFDNIANADGIVRRNKQTGAYSAMGTGLASGTVPTVNTMVIAPNGELYFGGSNITSAGGAANTANLAKWNGTSWVSITPGGSPNGSVFALAFGPTGLLYAAGSFTSINGVAANRVAVYDGSTWSALAGGLAGSAFALAVDNRTGLVYIGHADPALGFISTWDGSSLVEIGNGELDNSVRALAIAQNGLVYIGGQFTGGVAVWNGSIIQILGSGTNDTVFALAIGPDGILYLSGEFTQAGDIVLADQIAGWNGYTYFHLDIDLPGTRVPAIYPSRYDTDPLVPQNYTLYLGFNASGDAFYSGLEIAQNEGTISAFPKIVFSRSGGDGAIIQTLRNERTGRKLLFDYALLDGESLTINLNPKNRTIVSSFFGPRMDARLKNDDFSVWQLLPGENQVSAFVSEDGSPDVQGYLIFREPYKSWN